MSLLIATVALAGGYVQSHALQTRVALVTANPEQARTLGRWLGITYGVVPVTEAQLLSRSFPLNAEHLGEGGVTRRVGILMPRVPTDKTLDAYVPWLKKELAALKRLPSPRALYVTLPEGTGTDPEFMATYVYPLVRQAAREAGAKVIEPEANASFAETVGEAILDQRLVKRTWRVVSADSEQADEGPARNAIDGLPDTYWHTAYEPTTPKYPHELIVDLGETGKLRGFRYWPRQDGGTNGRVKAYEFFVSRDGQDWSSVAKGTFDKGSGASRVLFVGPVTARYFRFVALSEQSGGPWASAAEIDVLKAKG